MLQDFFVEIKSRITFYLSYASFSSYLIDPFKQLRPKSVYFLFHFFSKFSVVPMNRSHHHDEFSYYKRNKFFEAFDKCHKQKLYTNFKMLIKHWRVQMNFNFPYIFFSHFLKSKYVSLKCTLLSNSCQCSFRSKFLNAHTHKFRCALRMKTTVTEAYSFAKMFI